MRIKWHSLSAMSGQNFIHLPLLVAGAILSLLIGMIFGLGIIRLSNMVSIVGWGVVLIGGSMLVLCMPPAKIYGLWPIAFVSISFISMLFKYRCCPKAADVVLIGYVPFLLVAIFALISGTLRGIRLSFPRSRLLRLSLIGILVYGLFSLLWVEDYQSWLVYFGMWFFYIFVILVGVSSYISRSMADAKKLLDNYILGVGVAFGISIVTFVLVAQNAYARPLPVVHRGIPSFVAAQLFPVVIALYLTQKKPVYLLTAVTYVLGILLIKSRTGIVGTTIGLILAFVLLNKPHLMGRRKVFIAVMVVFSVLVALSLEGKPLLDRVKQVFNWLNIAEGRIEQGELDYRRAVMWSEAISVFRRHMLLGTGMGLDNYLLKVARYIFVPKYFLARPHNLYLSYLGAFGIIGFLPLIGFLFGLAYWYWYNSRFIRVQELRLIGKAFFIGHVSILVMFLGQEHITNPFVWFGWGLGIAFVRAAQHTPAYDSESMSGN